jgi:hypothetical protein
MDIANSSLVVPAQAGTHFSTAPKFARYTEALPMISRPVPRNDGPGFRRGDDEGAELGYIHNLGLDPGIDLRVHGWPVNRCPLLHLFAAAFGGFIE